MKIKNGYRNFFFIICTIIFLLLNQSSYAQNSIRVEHLLTEDGLSQNDLNSIYQDKKGFMWFGTHDGLNKYNGYEFEVFKPNSNDSLSINSNLIFEVIGDKDDNLWIATTGSGLDFYNRSTNKFTHFVHDDNDKNSLNNNHVNSIFLDSKNRLWVSSLKGIDMLDLNEETDKPKFNHIQFSEDYPFASKRISITSFFEDKDGQLWVCETNGIGRLVRDHKEGFIYENVNAYFGFYSQNIAVRCIGEDIYGKLLLGTTGGLFIVHQNNGTVNKEIIKSGVFNKLETFKNQIWTGTLDGLIHLETNEITGKIEEIDHFKFDPNNPKFSLSKSSVKSLFIDKTGIIWVGANGGGVSKIDPNRKRFRFFSKTINPNSLSVANVKSVFEDSNGTLWFGTEEGGLNAVTKEENDGTYSSFKKYTDERLSISPIEIIEVQEGERKKLYFGVANSSGLFSLDITDKKLNKKTNFKINTEISKSLFSILQDKNSNFWFGTYNGGLYRWLKSGDNEYKKDILFNNPNDSKSISNNIIRDIFQDRKGDIWFATANGLCYLTKEESIKKNPKFKIYKNIKGDENSLSHNYILSVFESSKGDIWIGTFGGGLNKFIPSKNGENGSFKVYSKKDGLPNDVIKGILEDDNNNLWLSTNGGLSKFNITNEEFKNYDVNDGLQSNEFSELVCLKRDNGEMIFGGVNGFNVFSPESIEDNKEMPETVITNLLVFNKKVNVGEELEGRVLLEKPIDITKEVDFKYTENSFSFEFAALHYSAPAKNHYAYKLEGFNEDWIYTTSNKRYATYTNLEPGKYTFKVKASNNDGFWDETPVELEVNIIPPFWSTDFANFIYILLFFGGLILFRRFTIIRSTKKHDLELEHLEKENYEEVQRLKLEFFTNISHEFRTPLTLIKGPLDYLKKLDDQTISKDVREQHELMSKNTNYLLRLVNQLLDFRKMDKGIMELKIGNSDIVKFINVVGEPFQFLSHKKNIDFQINATKESIKAWFDPDAVEKIANNLLSNAFKFTPKGGSISVEICEGKDFIHPKGKETNIDGNNYIVIQVKDSGPGIPKHRINIIFERFYVDRDFRKINSEGSGIGLNFTKKLVELHNGVIDVVSDEGLGTNFIVWIPREKRAYESKKGVSFSTEEESKTFITDTNAQTHITGVLDDIVDENIIKKRSKLPVVLVVDDNADIRSFVKKGLKDKFDIYEAENGLRAFELANKLMPNVIVTDILMPVMDGIEFCDKIKTTQETSHIPVIMLTAKTSEEWEIEGLKTGADAYIRKPFDMEVVELKIKNILKHREELRKRFNREITLQPNEVTVTSTDEKFLQESIEIVEKHMMDSDFSVEILVKEMALSRSTFYLKIKELTGLSTGEFIRNIRLKRAMQLLEKSNLSVKEIMFMTGFNTASYFSKCFKKQFGVIPSKYVSQFKKTNEKDSDE
ncbi:hybrid sensor histidine kinase/response regulator transcription factor [Lutibacter citreus]|uniref:hybrid sensor histidine kinase/response regulator transcription factor n=1 Tax=Lutibacter citreus TaxID=2138210 RepID=UPI000DBE57B6|nr:hybrid sensor histidine kinase/response regulator transcription factor [Lutibacter citreus]